MLTNESPRCRLSNNQLLTLGRVLTFQVSKKWEKGANGGRNQKGSGGMLPPNPCPYW